MTAEAIATIAAAVVALTQLAKWGGIPDKSGPVAVLLLSALGVAFWGYSTEPTWDRNILFTYFSAWIVVATSAAGVYGFTRAAGAAVTSAKPEPPDHVTREMLITLAAEISEINARLGLQAGPDNPPPARSAVGRSAGQGPP